MRDICDITETVKATSGRLEVWLNNYCEFFEQETGRMFSRRECWYCKYGEFGIYTEHPTKNGVCSFKTTNSGILDSFAKRRENAPSVQASKKQEEETK